MRSKGTDETAFLDFYERKCHFDPPQPLARGHAGRRSNGVRSHQPPVSGPFEVPLVPPPGTFAGAPLFRTLRELTSLFR